MAASYMYRYHEGIPDYTAPLLHCNTPYQAGYFNFLFRFTIICLVTNLENGILVTVHMCIMQNRVLKATISVPGAHLHGIIL